MPSDLMLALLDLQQSHLSNGTKYCVQRVDHAEVWIDLTKQTKHWTKLEQIMLLLRKHPNNGGSPAIGWNKKKVLTGQVPPPSGCWGTAVYRIIATGPWKIHVTSIKNDKTLFFIGDINMNYINRPPPTKKSTLTNGIVTVSKTLWNSIFPGSWGGGHLAR